MKYFSFIFVRAGSLEHMGFAAYATCETFHLEAAIYVVSVWLFVWGAIVFFRQDVPEIKPKKKVSTRVEEEIAA
jgi:hypothetical protein